VAPGGDRLLVIYFQLSAGLAKKVLLFLRKAGKPMLKLSRFALILGLAGATAGLPSLTAQQEGQNEGGVGGAIRFEKAKQAAADRQAGIEARQERESHSADRMAPEPKRKTRDVRKDSADRKTTLPEPR
jgi:hypothetical protein